MRKISRTFFILQRKSCYGSTTIKRQLAENFPRMTKRKSIDFSQVFFKSHRFLNFFPPTHSAIIIDFLRIFIKFSRAFHNKKKQLFPMIFTLFHFLFILHQNVNFSTQKKILEIFTSTKFTF
jgi:hypothetical protein